VTHLGGPFYEDIEPGQVFDGAPALTITDGHAALHQAITGARLRLTLDATLCAHVTGSSQRIAHPGLVCDIAIGQSTLATQRVIANLFYRGLVLLRMPEIGDTLRTNTEVVAMRDNSERPGRRPTGLVVLHVRTTDQHSRPVLDFHRCAMLPMRPDTRPPGHADGFDSISDAIAPEQLRAAVAGWDLGAYRELVPGPHGASVTAGSRFVLEHGDTVSSAPELPRLSLNLAAAHSDPAAGSDGRRLVYGGHTIGLALTHAVRALPALVTVVAWRSCEHLAPVFEGDIIRSTVTVERVEPGPAEGKLVELRLQSAADRIAGGGADAVLDLRAVGVMA
jgi:acyl dehydratase